MKPVAARVPRLLLPLLLAPLAGCAEEVSETPPRQIAAGSPFHYPEELWDAGVEGETVLRLFVTEGGTVDSVQVDRASGYEGFDSAAARGARELSFEPARRGEEPVSVWVLLPVQFERQPAAQPAGSANGVDTLAAPRP